MVCRVGRSDWLVSDPRLFSDDGTVYRLVRGKRDETCDECRAGRCVQRLLSYPDWPPDEHATIHGANLELN